MKLSLIRIRGGKPFFHIEYSKILLPALAEIFVVLEEGGGLELLLRSATESLERDRIVTGIGVVGGQLGWSQWMNVFKAHRLLSLEHTDCAPSCRSTVSSLLR